MPDEDKIKKEINKENDRKFENIVKEIIKKFKIKSQKGITRIKVTINEDQEILKKVKESLEDKGFKISYIRHSNKVDDIDNDIEVYIDNSSEIEKEKNRLKDLYQIFDNYKKYREKAKKEIEEEIDKKILQAKNNAKSIMYYEIPCSTVNEPSLTKDDAKNIIEKYRNNGFEILMENEVSTKGSDFRIEISIKL